MGRETRPPKTGPALGVIVLVLTVAGLLLSKYTMGGPGLSKTWPALPIAVGFLFMFGGLLEMGLGISGFFGLIMANNLGYVSFSKTWPFLIVGAAVLVGIGYVRARSRAKAGG